MHYGRSVRVRAAYMLFPEGKSLGAIEYDTCFGHTCSVAFICPVCGQLWSRVFKQYKNLPQDWTDFPWSAKILECAEHGDGSFFFNETALLTEAIPTPVELTKYELSIFSLGAKL